MNMVIIIKPVKVFPYRDSSFSGQVVLVLASKNDLLINIQLKPNSYRLYLEIVNIVFTELQSCLS